MFCHSRKHSEYGPCRFSGSGISCWCHHHRHIGHPHTEAVGNLLCQHCITFGRLGKAALRFISTGGLEGTLKNCQSESRVVPWIVRISAETERKKMMLLRGCATMMSSQQSLPCLSCSRVSTVRVQSLRFRASSRACAPSQSSRL